eukprot:3255563-Rhodomonas_salina.1
MFFATEEGFRDAVQALIEDLGEQNADNRTTMNEFYDAFANNNSAWFDNVQNEEEELGDKAGLWELKDSGGA